MKCNTKVSVPKEKDNPGISFAELRFHQATIKQNYKVMQPSCSAVPKIACICIEGSPDKSGQAMLTL
jgi:hypothetical protein